MTTAEPAVLAVPTSRSDDTMQYAYELLRADILMGTLRPGVVLSQVQLASRLGISRTPLREALRRLAAEGLITGDFNRRVRVSELDLGDFDQIYAMRIALEPVAFGVTLPLLTDTQLGDISAAVDRMDAAIALGDRAGFRDAHRAFHLGLLMHAGQRMRRVLAELWDHSERYRLRYLHTEGPDITGTTLVRLQPSQTEHREILSAALARDVRRATSNELDHLQRTLGAVLREAAPPPEARLTRLAAGFR